MKRKNSSLENLSNKKTSINKNSNNFNIISLEVLIKILLMVKNDFKTIFNFLKCSKFYYKNLLIEDYFMKNTPFFIKKNCDLKYLKNNKMLKFIKNLSCENFRGITDEYFEYFENLKILNISDCHQITDKVFSYLSGIHTVNMNLCNQKTITDKAFSYLNGIHTLHMSWCNQNTITDKAFSYLSGIHALDMSCCDQKTITYK
jgi:hypothetical protein